MNLLQVKGVSEPLTMGDILKEKWIMFDSPITGEELLLYDTVPWEPVKYDESLHALLSYNWKGEMVKWEKDDALSLIQTFYRNPIDWEKQKWVVFVLKKVDKGEPVGRINFATKYPKLIYPIVTTIRKAKSKSARFNVNDVVSAVSRRRRILRCPKCGNIGYAKDVMGGHTWKIGHGSYDCEFVFNTDNEVCI